MPFLYLKHADALTADEGRKTISCDVDNELSADWLSAAGYGNAAPSANLFTRLEDKIQSLPMHIREISGSGFTFASREMVEVNDLLRIQGGKGILKDLDGSPARVVREGSGQNFARFIKLSPEDREALLEYIVPKISTDAFKKRAGERAAAKE